MPLLLTCLRGWWAEEPSGRWLLISTPASGQCAKAYLEIQYPYLLWFSVAPSGQDALNEYLKTKAVTIEYWVNVQPADPWSSDVCEDTEQRDMQRDMWWMMSTQWYQLRPAAVSQQLLSRLLIILTCRTCPTCECSVLWTCVVSNMVYIRSCNISNNENYWSPSCLCLVTADVLINL